MDSITTTNIEKIIYVIRGKCVMLDSDLADLYQVETKALNRSVRRHIRRFPEDFMFQLTSQEYESLRYQFGTLEGGKGQHRKYLPLVFTEQGIAMPSGILNSDRAVDVNIAVMRTFVKLRHHVVRSGDTARINEIEKNTDSFFKVVFQRLDRLERITPSLPEKRRKIGIKSE